MDLLTANWSQIELIFLLCYNLTGWYSQLDHSSDSNQTDIDDHHKKYEQVNALKDQKLSHNSFLC